MKNFKKPYLIATLIFFLTPIILIIGILLFMFLTKDYVRIIGVVSCMVLFLLIFFIIKPRYEFYKMKYKFEKLSSSDLLISNTISIEKLYENIKSQNYLLQSEDKNISCYYKIVSAGSIWFPGKMKFDVLLWIHNKDYDFKHPKIGYVLAQLNVEIAKKAKSSNYSVITLKHNNADPNLDDIKNIVFNKTNELSYTQINVFINEKNSFHLENKNYYPTKEYKNICIQIENLLK